MKDSSTARARIMKLKASGHLSSEDAELLTSTLQFQDETISNLREIKSGYCDAMIAWRRLAEDGVPLETSLARLTPASPVHLN